MFGYLLSCLMLVALPIIVVQYPRYLDTHASSECAPVGTEPVLIHDLDGTGAGETATPSSETSAPSPSPGRSVSAATSGVDMRSPESKKRKPWDPPFPTSRTFKREPYRILGPSTEVVVEEPRTEKPEFETERLEIPVEVNEGGNKKQAEGLSHGPRSLKSPSPLNLAAPEPLAKSSPTRLKDSTSLVKPRDTSGFHPSLLKSVILILIFIIFIFAFAILVAHCLAWFLVYKTESRLGEVRRGLLRGGDMRMCLCAKG